MNRQATALVAFLRSFKGYLEKEINAKLEDFLANAGDENYTMFGKWYDDYFNTSGFNGAAWCHDFVSYGSYKTGLTPDQVPYTASCGTGVGWFERHSAFHYRKGYTPKVGDFIYFHHGDFKPAHVGVVYAVTATRVFTIEGNTSGGSTLIANGGGVSEKSYPLTYANILGYGTPLYSEDQEDLMSQFIENMATKYGKSTTEVETALETILQIALHDPAQWEKDASNTLLLKGLAMQTHDPREIVTFATLGAIEGRRK